MAQQLHTVLVVDDEPAVRTFVRRILEREGYCVKEAAHGGDALEVAATIEAPIHLLLTDVRMAPNMGGAELVRRLLEDRPGTRVLYMSGFSDDPVVEDDVQTGRAGFLAKPFGPAVLKDKVRQTLADVTPPVPGQATAC